MPLVMRDGWSSVEPNDEPALIVHLGIGSVAFFVGQLNIPTVLVPINQDKFNTGLLPGCLARDGICTLYLSSDCQTSPLWNTTTTEGSSSQLPVVLRETVPGLQGLAAKVSKANLLRGRTYQL
jgi:hypothetical protein